MKTVVGAIIKNPKNEYLLQLRDDRAPTFKNCWTLFGGHVEEGERPDEALLRELEEELSLKSEAIQSVKEVEINHGGIGDPAQYIYEVLTDVVLYELILCEGAAMEYVTEQSLFDREFAFNIEEVLRRYFQLRDTR